MIKGAKGEKKGENPSNLLQYGQVKRPKITSWITDTIQAQFEPSSRNPNGSETQMEVIKVERRR